LLSKCSRQYKERGDDNAKTPFKTYENKDRTVDVKMRKSLLLTYFLFLSWLYDIITFILSDVETLKTCGLTTKLGQAPVTSTLYS
jgi:hypothetical protein